MDDDEAADSAHTGASVELALKLDTVAGAVAAIAATHTELLSHVAEAEARRSHETREVAQRLEALERQLLALPSNAIPPPPGAPVAEADVESLRGDMSLTLDVLARMAEGIERFDTRTEDRLAAVRDAALAPVADLQALLSARNEHQDTQLSELAAAVQALAEREEEPGPEAVAELTEAVRNLSARPPDSSAAVLERVEELASAVQALTWQLPELVEELAAVRAQVEGIDVAGPMAEVTHELSGRLTLHTDTALAGALRLIDDRLAALRNVMTEAGSSSASAQQNVGGFEAGAVMGAAQAAWNRLEQRLDSEFDDLSRQLQALASLIDQVVTSTEAVANRPVVTGDQLRRAASAVRDTVVGANRARRDRRGGSATRAMRSSGCTTATRTWPAPAGP
jgi:hypothetical protein